MKTKETAKKLWDLGARPGNVLSTINHLPKKERMEARERLVPISRVIDALTKAADKKQALAADKTEAAKYRLSIKAYRELYKKARQILDTLRTSHSMGCNKTLYVDGSPFANVDRRTYYSGKYAGREAHGHVDLDLTLKELKNITNIGGVWTLLGAPADGHPKIRHAERLSDMSKAYYTCDLTFIPCYVTAGFHATNLDEAIAWRKKRAESLLDIRQDRARELTNLHRFVGLKHSLSAGNCEAGTIAFAQRHGLDPNMGYRIDYLLSLEDTPYTRALLRLK